jgi:hypothetical protein
MHSQRATKLRGPAGRKKRRKPQQEFLMEHPFHVQSDCLDTELKEVCIL